MQRYETGLRLMMTLYSNEYVHIINTRGFCEKLDLKEAVTLFISGNLPETYE